MKNIISMFSKISSIMIRVFMLAALLLSIFSPIQSVWADTPIFTTPDWGSMAQMQVGQPWSYDFDATSSDGGIVYSITSNPIPGLSINTSTGVYSGTPTQLGSYPIEITATDSQDDIGTLTHTFKVVSSSTLTITELTTTYPYGDYVTDYPVWVVIQLDPATGSDYPDNIVVNITTDKEGAPGPNCDAEINENGYGDCGLTFEDPGDYLITAAFSGSTYLLASSNDTENITVGSPITTFEKDLVAGVFHSCYKDQFGEVTCWGMEESYTEQDSEGTILSSINDETVIQVSAGGYHTCGLYADGSIQCWGDSAEIINQVPNSVNGKTIHYIKINSGDDHVCAIDSGYRLHCWGELNEELESSIPNNQVVDLDTGKNHDCAILKNNNEVVCWGNNDQEQIDVPASLGAVNQVSVGSTHTCVIKTDESVDCWGTAFPDPDPSLDFIKIDSGSNFTCGLTDADAIECWGTNSLINAAPTSGSFALLGSGTQHVCAVDQDGSGPYLSCWGNNDHNQAPTLSLSPDTLSEYLPLGLEWEQVFNASGGTEPYLLSTSGTLPSGISLVTMTLSGTLTEINQYDFAMMLTETYSASSLIPFELKPVTHNFTIHVEDPSTSIVINNATNNTDVGMPVNVQVTVNKSGTPDFSGFVTINGQESNTTCQAAVDPSTGNAECSIYFGTPGTKTILASYDGDDFYQATTSSAQTTVTINPIVIEPDITAGDQFNCSLNSSGQVYCWGKDDSNQTTPPSSGFKEISAGSSHACGITVQSSLSCWGWNGFGVTSPTTSMGSVEVTSGETHSCARNTTGSVTCWGDSSNDLTNVPDTTFSQIDAGAFHTCGIRSSDQHVLCWGKNNDHQLDLGIYGSTAFNQISAGEKSTCGITTSNTLACWGTLVAPPTGTFQAVSVGTDHACAINTSGSLVCWGDNTDGKTTPPNGIYTTVQSGSDHSCAIRADGYLKCWGSNNFGQAPQLTLLPNSVPTLSVGEDWDSSFSISGGRDSSYSFSVVNGSLPMGLTLDSNTGEVSGTLTTGNDYQYTIRVFEENLTPALITEKTYQQRVKANIEFGQVEANPINPVVGQAATLHFSVAEAADSAYDILPSGNLAVSINGVKTCELILTNGEASCLVFFETAGEKTIFVEYDGDEYFLPGDTNGAETIIAVTPFSQDIHLRSGFTQTYIHLPDGTLTCIGDGCALDVFNKIYTVFSSGGSLSCGLQTDGQVLCLSGENQTIYPGPYQSLAVGKDHACALDLNGEISCWGNNDYGQTTSPSGIFTQIFSGENASCAIRQDNQLPFCWGDPGIIGVPSTIFTEISIGSGFACGLTVNGSIQCWGTAGSLQLDAPVGTNFVQLSGGKQHTCALDSTEGITCWGEINGEEAIPPYGSFFEMNGSDDHTCALREENQITCWGEDDAGEAPQILVIHLEDVETPALTYWEHFFEPSNGQSPYTGSVISGSLPTGTNFNFSPSGLVMYGIPTLPGRFDFALRWVDSGNPQLVLEELHRITVTGTDLKMEISADHPSTALFDNPFSFFYTVTNQTDLDVEKVLVTILLPNGMDNFTVSGFTDCEELDGQISCLLPILNAHTSLTIKVNGQVTAEVNQQIVTNAEVESTLQNWPEINSTDNEKQLSVGVLYSALLLDEDFSEQPSEGWLNGDNISAPGGESYLGDFDNTQNLRLLLENLAPHRGINISFDLYVIGEWQGNGTITNPLPAIYQFGQTSGETFLRTTFCNQGCTQAYPGSYPGGFYNALTGAEAVDVLGFPGVTDSVYHFTYQYKHSDSALDLTWLSENLPDGVRFGIDHVVINLDSGWQFVFIPMVNK